MTTEYELEYLLENPQESAKLVGRRILIEIKSKIRPTVDGYMHSMDPVRGSILLIHVDNDVLSSVDLIISEHIKRIIVHERYFISVDTVKSFTSRQESQVEQQDVQKNKEMMIEKLIKAKIPFEESIGSTSLTIMGYAELKSPFSSSEDLFSTNEIILSRLQSLLFDG